MYIHHFSGITGPALANGIAQGDTERQLNRYRKGRGFESCESPNFFKTLFATC